VTQSTFDVHSVTKTFVLTEIRAPPRRELRVITQKKFSGLAFAKIFLRALLPKDRAMCSEVVKCDKITFLLLTTYARRH